MIKTMLYSVCSSFCLIREAYVEILKPNKSNVRLLLKCMSFVKRPCFNIKHLIEEQDRRKKIKSSCFISPFGKLYPSF